MYTTIKKGKGDGNYGFTSDHLIYGGHRLHVLLSILFNVMLQHGYNAKDLILSSIISIPKDMKTSLSSSTNYRGISLFNTIGISDVNGDASQARANELMSKL